MNVQIAKSGAQEAEAMANTVLQKIEQKLKREGIGVY